MRLQYPKKPKSVLLQEIYSFLYQMVEELNRSNQVLQIGETTLSEDEVKQLKKLIRGGK